MILKNTQNIQNMSDMAPYTTAVMNYVEGNNLPSYSYPEVYEYMVAQKDLGVEESLDGYLSFNLGENFENLSVDEYHGLADHIRDMEAHGILYFQRKNNAVTEVERDVRAAEHLVAKAKQVLVEAQQVLTESKLKLNHAQVASEAVVA